MEEEKITMPPYVASQANQPNEAGMEANATNDDTMESVQDPKMEAGIDTEIETTPISVDKSESQTKTERKESKMKERKHPTSVTTIAASVLLSSMFGFGGGYYASTTNNAIGNNNPTVLYQSVPTSANTNEANSTSLIAISSLTADSVVEITTETMTTGNFMQQAIGTGAGSGVVISSDGYIVTNNHVVADSNKISVRLKDGTTYSATIVGTDTKTDIALIKIEASNLQAAVFGDSSALKVGEQIIAVGNPLGQLGGTVTNGIISALDREITIDNETMRLLQTNAAINPGNSGGGLFNMNGELVGIVNAKSSGTDIEGLGFAIPINDAKAVVTDLIEHGYVTGRVQLGITVLDISTQQLANYYRYEKLGVYIQEISKNSSAAEAGLQSQDRIVSFQGVTINSFSDLKAQLEKTTVGDHVVMVVEREEVEKTIAIVMKEYIPDTSIVNEG